MVLYVYTKAPVWWTPEEWEMSPKEKEKIGIKLVKIKINEN